MTSGETILRFLIDLPGVFLPHSKATLFEHLIGTHALLETWGYDRSTCLAGLFHSIYGTTAYRSASLPPSRSGELIALIGPDAEALARRFSTIAWPRLLERPETLDTLPAALIAIAAANIVEQYRRMTIEGAGLDEVRRALRPFLALAPYLLPAAATALTRELDIGD